MVLMSAKLPDGRDVLVEDGQRAASTSNGRIPRWLAAALWSLAATLAALVVTLSGAWASNTEARVKSLEAQQSDSRERLAVLEASVQSFTEIVRDFKTESADRNKTLQMRVDQILQELRRQ